MAEPSKHLLAMPAVATTAVFSLFAIYYILAAPHVVKTSAAHYMHLEGQLLHVLSLVPSGFVRKRGVLFLAEVLFAQFASKVEPAYEGMVAFLWAMRLVLGAAYTYYSVALHPRVWRPWPGTAEVVCMSVLALLWIQASVKASREDRRKATAHIIDSVEASAVHTGTAANASYRAKSSLSPKSTYQALPTPISVVFMVSALLGSAGLLMMLKPGPFIQTVVSDTFNSHHDAIVDAAAAYPDYSPLLVVSAVHLSTCQAFASQVGLQLLMEAGQLVLLPRVLSGLQSVLSLLLVCAARAALTTVVNVYNYSVDGLERTVHMDTVISAAFTAAYLALYYTFRNHRRPVNADSPF